MEEEFQEEIQFLLHSIQQAVWTTIWQKITYDKIAKKEKIGKGILGSS